MQKTLASRRGSLWFSVAGASVATVPPRSSVLPPGAGNEPKKPIKARKRAKKREERYVGEALVVDRHMDAAAIRRDDDGDATAILAIETAQGGLQVAIADPRPGSVRAV